MQKITRDHLQESSLQSYFAVRHLLGLLGFSYLHAEGSREPAATSDPALRDLPSMHLWAIHLALCSDGILAEYQNGKLRSAAIHAVIMDHQILLHAQYVGAKGYKYSLTYNLVQVIRMSQVISDLRNRVTQLEEQARRSEEEKLAAEGKAERYRRKLRELGVNESEL